MALTCEIEIPNNTQLVVTFQIPRGSMICLVGEVKSVRKDSSSGDNFVYGLAFRPVDFAIRRQIRAFVSSWNDGNQDD